MATEEELYSRQRMQEEIQRSDEFANLFGKIVSGGKSSYKTVVQVKPITIKCKGCGIELRKEQKFCHECGHKNEQVPKKE